MAQSEEHLAGTTAETWQDEVRRVASEIRRRAVELAVRQGGGYVIQACGAADILAMLHARLMDVGPSAAPLRPEPFAGVPAPDRERVWGGDFNGARVAGTDRFLLSPAHYSAAVYATLVAVGRLDPDVLAEFNRDGSTLEMIGADHSPGIEAVGGSLAQVLSVGVGQALARRSAGAAGRIWVFMSDGELEEGQTWEALAAASHYGLANLCVYLDANGHQVDGPVPGVMGVEPIAARIEAFGWAVREIDGHDLEALDRAAEPDPSGRPVIAVCRTRPCEGVPSLAARPPHKLHYIRFVGDEAEAALADVGAVATAAGARA